MAVVARVLRWGIWLTVASFPRQEDPRNPAHLAGFFVGPAGV